jgi:hypothetical protein
LVRVERVAAHAEVLVAVVLRDRGPGATDEQDEEARDE